MIVLAAVILGAVATMLTVTVVTVRQRNRWHRDMLAFLAFHDPKGGNRT